MTIEEVIKTWKDELKWAGDVLNPFLQKNFFGLKNPIMDGEWLLRFVIDEMTTFVDDQLVPYHAEFEYHTYSLSGNEEERERELKRLESELTDFTNRAKEERFNEIASWQKDGKVVTTSNYYSF